MLGVLWMITSAASLKNLSLSIQRPVLLWFIFQLIPSTWMLAVGITERGWASARNLGDQPLGQQEVAFFTGVTVRLPDAQVSSYA